MARYVVNTYDRCGQLSETSCVDFAHCVAVARIVARRVGKLVAIRAFNLDNVDLNFDGLTDEERDAVDVATDEGIAEWVRFWDASRPEASK